MINKTCLLVAIGGLAGLAAGFLQNRQPLKLKDPPAIRNVAATVQIVYYDGPRPGEPMPTIHKGLLRAFDGSGNLIVDVNERGEATYGKGYTPNAAATIFWRAIAETYPAVCGAGVRTPQQKAGKP